MKAAIVEQLGQPPVYGDFAEPEPHEGEVRIAVAAAALSQLTRARASGTHYSSAAQVPFGVGVDGVGRLDDGRRVYFMLPRAPFGAMAEWTVAPEVHCAPIPDDLDDATAAAIANPCMSSWAALVERAQIRAGETVLVNGATGAAGQLAVRIARHLGASRVIATGRNQSVLASLGADATVVLAGDEEALGRAFHEHFAAGVDIVLDYLYGPSARALLATGAKAAPAGSSIRFVQIGSAGGGEIALPASVLRSSGIVMMGSGLGSVSMERLLASIVGAFGAAVSTGLTLDHRVELLADVNRVWTQADGAGRIVFKINGAG